MALLLNANTLWLNLFLFFIIILSVVLMPLADRKICERVGLSLTHGMGKSSKTERLTHIRRYLLYFIFACYVAANIWLVFFSRSTRSGYSVHIAPLQDLGNSVSFQSTFAEFIGSVLTGDLSGAFHQVSIVKPEDIAQAATNLMFYVPFGYLLPYVFRWFRKNNVRPAVACFLGSAATENLQLIFRRGCYDFDDLFFNTLGGCIGILLFRAFAYQITNPDWRKQRKKDRSFRKRAKSTSLFRYSRELDCGRVTVLATMEEDIYSFFVEKLGFRLIGQHVDFSSNASTLALELGGLCIEFRCGNQPGELPAQNIMMSAVNLDKMRRRLEKHGVTVSDYAPDPYTHNRSMTIVGPDNIHLEFCEY